MMASHHLIRDEQRKCNDFFNTSSSPRDASHNDVVASPDVRAPILQRTNRISLSSDPNTHYDAISLVSSFGQNDHSSAAISTSSTLAHSELAGLTNPKDDVIPLTPAKKKNFRDASDGSWKTAKQFTDANTSLLSTDSTIETAVDPNTNKLCSTTQTLMNLTKSFTGTGLLSLPVAFKNSGIWVGFGSFVIVVLVAFHCTHVLERCTSILERRHLVTALGQIMQCGYCSVYIVFVASNVKVVVDQFWPASPDLRIYEVVIYLLLLPYIFVRSLRALAIFSSIANVMYLFSIVIIYQYLFQDLPDINNRPAFNSWSTLFLFFGATIFCFEGIILLIPLRCTMRHPEDMGGLTGVLTVGMVLTIVVYFATGFYGYLKFGDDVAATLTLNLPQDQWLYLMVDLFFAANIFLSFGVQFYVPVSAVWSLVEEKMTSQKFRALAEGSVRIGLLSVIALMAVIVPQLDLLMSLFGAFLGSMLLIILPAILEMVTLCGERQLTRFAIIRNVFIILFGLFGFVTGMYASVLNIINRF